MADVITELLRDIPIPRMLQVRQRFDEAALTDVERAVETELRALDLADAVRPGMRIAVTVGSRGVADIPLIAKTVVAFLRGAGAEPFIVPAMGSHGGATPEGQIGVLRSLGVTEESVGAPIQSSMAVDKIGELANGLPIYVDHYAANADGIVVINRVKPHTAFRGPVESGLMKMLSIGLGKQKGAEACHQLGFRHMAEHVPQMARVMLAKLPILFGLASVENAYDRVALVQAVMPNEMEACEIELLKQAKALMPRICFDKIDVLVVDELGKNISGDGMDPNITGRFPTPYAEGGPDVTKIVLFGLTPETEGNANGIGLADFTTEAVFTQMDRSKTYANGLTSTVVAPTKVPMLLADKRSALQAAVKTSNVLDYRTVRIVHIKNTLSLGQIAVSETMRDETAGNPDLEIISEPFEWEF